MSELEIFVAALQQVEKLERAAFLDEACGADSPLRARIEQLLAAHEGQDPLLDRRPAALLQQPPVCGLAPVDLATQSRSTCAPEMQPGDVAGHYQLLERISEGGMGEVWVARQSQPVKRKVALKVLKPGMDSRAVLARFEQERQALALMDHPNIARVFDAGMNAAGRPFFVMELVNGLPLAKFCDDARLTPRQRLELFVPICQAVQHAHTKGIIHRDLKPSNILVTLIDGKPVPKVIDFGIAKATGERLTEESLSTQFGAVVGTLGYMSPEQAGYSGVDIDTRTDVYSLGVILYELLTGLRPLDAHRARSASLPEAIRILRDEEPTTPSARLSTSEALPTLAGLRQTEPRRLMAMLRGDLDWVVMKCLEKQRDRRYETADGLARDVQRFLANEPVEARPPSLAYRVRKYLSRNRGPALAVLLVFLALIGGIVGIGVGLLRAEAARQKEHAAREQAEKRLKQIVKFNELLASIFQNLDPREVAEGGRPLRTILAEKLDRVVAELDGDSIGDPLLVTELQTQCGKSLLGLGEPGKAVVLLKKARTTLETHHGNDHMHTLICSNYLAQAYLQAGALERAVSLFQENLRLLRARFGNEHPDTIASMNNLAWAYQSANRPDLALPLLEEAVRTRRDMGGGGDDRQSTLTNQANLAACYQMCGRLEEAGTLSEQTLEAMTTHLGRDHPETLTCMSNLALNLRLRGKFDRSVPLGEETLKRCQAKFGRQHPETLNAGANLGINYYKDVGRVAEALPLLEAAYRGAEKHPKLRFVDRHLRDCYLKAGMSEKAASVAKERNLEEPGLLATTWSLLDQAISPLRKPSQPAPKGKSSPDRGKGKQDPWAK